ncbi:MAP kinase kinase kinase mkh1 [Diplonema papillatum]|nr:MAP kinase kinase kinase mkh1 [Diplonema papillatum]
MSDDAAENAFVQYLRDNRIHDCLEKQMRHLRAHPKVAPLDAIAQWAASEKSRSTGKVSDDLLALTKKGALLGSGSFAKVYLGSLPNGKFIAVKEVRLSGEGEGEDGEEDDLLAEIRSAQSEIRLMETVRHPNIVQCLGSQFKPDEGVFTIFMEYVGGSTLAAVTRGFGGLVLAIVKDYTRQIVNGVHALHSAGICHRDIKPENILVDLQNGLLKLCDFGCSKQIDRLKSGKKEKACRTVAGTLYYMSPEVLCDDEGYDGMSADIWSLGATVIQMTTGKLPWPKSSDMTAMFMISQAQGPPSEFPSVEQVGERCVNFISCCCAINPSDRPSSEELLHHPFVAFDD